MLRVKWKDVDLKLKTIKLHHTKANARTIPLSNELVKARMVGHSDLQMINKHYLAHNVEFLRSVVE